MNFKFTKSKYLYALLAILYLLLIKFPGRYVPVDVGLDNSWQYGINYLNGARHLLKQDVPTFTYGPLGYILVPLNIGSNLVQALIFLLFIHGLSIAVLVYYALRKDRPLQVVLFVVCYTFASLVGFGFINDDYENTFLIITCLLLYISSEENREARFAELLNAVLAGMFLFMKFSLGVAAIGMLGCSILIRLIRRRPDAKRRLLLTAGVYALTTFIIAAFYFGSLRIFAVWLATSWSIADGYSTVMSIEGDRSYVLWGVLGLLVYAVLLLLLRRYKSSLLDTAIALSIGIFFNFKHSFVRQDVHILFLFPFLLTAVGIIILNTKNATELKLSAASFLLLAMLAMPSALNYDRFNPQLVFHECAGGKGWTNISSLFNLRSVRRRLNAESRNNLEPKRLPDDWTQLIKQDGGTVDAIPWELTYSPANDLPWNPNPVLQLYSDYKAYLDQRCARHYLGRHAPAFLITEFAEINGRNPLLTAPATWRAILQNYEVIKAREPQGLHLLRKRAEPQAQSFSLLRQEESLVGQWVEVPPSDGLLYAFMRMRMNVVGHVAKTAYHIPPVNVTLLYESGRVMKHRIVPDTAQGGLLMNYLPLNMEELDRLLARRAMDRVIRFKVSGPGAFYFNKTFSIQWREDRSYIMPPAPTNEAQEVKLEGLPPLTQDTLLSIDTINSRPAYSPTPVEIDSESEDIIIFNGWAVDERAGDVAGGVFIVIDDRIEVRATYPQERGDVANYYKNSRYASSGFSAAILSESIGKGVHTLSLKILNNGKGGYYAPTQKVSFVVK